MYVPTELQRDVPCRISELSQLVNFFCHDGEPLPQCLFLCGHKSSGKSYTITKMLEHFRINYALVDCVEGYLPRLLFESIIDQLFGPTLLQSKCEDMMSFINLLNKAAENANFCWKSNVIANVLFPKYCEPVKTGTLRRDDTSGLFNSLRTAIQSSLKTLYLRVDVEKDAIDSGSSDADSSQKHQNLSSSATFALSFELPFYAKYLLIAAFLASYNSPKEDKKLFMKYSTRRRRKNLQNTLRKKVETNALMMGPKHFDLERLLAIFFSIVEEKPNISVNLLSQISSLVELKLLSKVGTDPVECPKYKCVVGFDFIMYISRTVNFAVMKYLICCQ